MSNIIQSNAKAMATKKETKSLKDYVTQMQGEIAKALPSVMTPERFTRIAMTALSSNPKLAECDAKTFLGAMMNAAQLGLEPNTPLGQAYLIPYRNKGKLECQFQIGYKGLIDLAYRSGEVEVIQAHTVYEADEFEYELGLNPVLKHIPAMENRGEPIYYYAVFKTKTGGYGFEVMSKADIDAHAKKTSQSFDSSYSPWKSNYNEMAKKTVIKKVLKYAPLRSDFATGIAQDSTIKSYKSDMELGDILVKEDETEYVDYTEVDESTGEVVENG